MTPTYLARGLKVSHLRLLDALVRSGQLAQAAAAISVSQPAASRLLAEVQQIAGGRLYQRRGRGIELTPAGLAFGERARRALLEISDAERDIAELGEGQAGLVRIGTVSGPSTDLVLPAIRALRQSAPNLQIEVEVAGSDRLGAMLLDNQLDFSISRLPEGLKSGLFHAMPLIAEPIAVVGRNGHPLAGRAQVALAETAGMDWVLPAEQAILRRTLVQVHRRCGLAEPVPVLVTTSLPLTVAYLQQSDALAVLATSLARVFAQGGRGTVVELPIIEAIEVETYMLLIRRNQALTPAARLLADAIRARVAVVA